MPRATLIAEYSYRSADGTLLYQKLRYAPKTFLQRRPTGADGWTADLEGVPRVIYRLPELKDRQAIVWCEGEKDVDAAWALGIPATCGHEGGGPWRPYFGEQLTAQGVRRVAILPDNDVPGRAHALAVAEGLNRVGLEVRLVTLPDLPAHGDLSDYLGAGHDKAALLALVKAVPVWTPPAAVDPPPAFRELGEQRYAFTLQNGTVLELDRLRRSSHELWGELLVRVNGQHAAARTFDHGILQAGDLNLSSVQARQTRAKLLKERSGDSDTDWFGGLEEFAIRVIGAERSGSPDVNLRDVSPPGPDRMIVFDGVELPVKHPTLIFGDGGSAKSYLALYWAGKMTEIGIPVLYIDWEWTKEEHRERLERLFGPVFPPVRHLEAYRSLQHERDRILASIRNRGIQYLIFDSVALACGGDPSGSEACTTYWQTVRQFKVGSLHIAHVTKGMNGKADDQKPFGSAFWHNMARQTYNIKGDQDGEEAINVGIYARKSQWGRRKDLALRVAFGPHRTTITPIDVGSVAQLAEGLPVKDRIAKALADDSKTRKELAELLDLDGGVIQRTIHRELTRGTLIEFPGKKGQQRIGLSESSALKPSPDPKGDSVEF